MKDRLITLLYVLLGCFIGGVWGLVILKPAKAAPQDPITAAVVRDTVKALKDIARNTGQIAQSLKRMEQRARSDQDPSKGDVRPRREEGVRSRLLQ